MKPSRRLSPSLTFLALLFLVSGLQSRCLALALLMDVSRERAKELGITVTPKTRADDVWVQVEFKTTGKLKGFRWADLALSQGGKTLVSAALAPQKPAADTVRLQFYVDPAALPSCTVTIFSYDGLEGIGYRLRMKDFPATAPSR